MNYQNISFLSESVHPKHVVPDSYIGYDYYTWIYFPITVIDMRNIVDISI